MTPEHCPLNQPHSCPCCKGSLEAIEDQFGGYIRCVRCGATDNGLDGSLYQKNQVMDLYPMHPGPGAHAGVAHNVAGQRQTAGYKRGHNPNSKAGKYHEWREGTRNA